MTRRDLLPLEGRPVDVAAPGNAHLLLCECGHGPDDHDAQAGCIALVIRPSDGVEDFCPCTKYEVAP